MSTRQSPSSAASRHAGPRRARTLVLLSGALLMAGVANGSVPGAADDPLLAFTRRLLALEARQPATVHVVVLGDSHVASGPEPAHLGAALHEVFGDGGPGFAMPWSAPRYYARDGVRTGSSPGWLLHLPRAAEGEVDGDLLGCFMETGRPGESAFIEGDGSRVRLFLLRQPGGGGVEVFIDGTLVARESLAAAAREVTEISRTIAPEVARHLVSIRTTTAGPVRILGVSLERPGGVAISPLGVIGARAELLVTGSSDTCFGGLLRRLDPAVVILAFGTNEAGEAGLDPVAYTRSLVRAIERIRAAAPATAVLLAGPPDRAVSTRRGWLTTPALPLVVESQRQACRVTGARFVDRLAAMGGQGSADRWARTSPALARQDRTHFTSEGYARLAGMVAAYAISVYNSVKASAEFATYLRQTSPDAVGELALAGRPVAVPAPVARLLTATASSPAASPRPPAAAAASGVAMVRDASGAITITNFPGQARKGSEEVRLGRGSGRLGGLATHGVGSGGPR